jgi:hypothetical protein
LGHSAECDAFTKDGLPANIDTVDPPELQD